MQRATFVGIACNKAGSPARVIGIIFDDLSVGCCFEYLSVGNASLVQVSVCMAAILIVVCGKLRLYKGDLLSG